jgi:hypothetical protein
MLVFRVEDTEMNANRVLTASAVGALLLGLGVLEVMSQRVRVDQPSAVVSDLGEARTHSWPDLDLALDPTASQETEAVYLVDAEDRSEH